MNESAQLREQAVIRIVHLTHTNIHQDNRILKEISALSKVPAYELYGIGIRKELGSKRSNSLPLAELQLLNLFAMGARWMPRVMRHPLMIAEATIRMWWQGYQVRPHIIHCHDATVLPAALMIKATTRATLIYDAHELESQKNGQSPLLSKLTYLLERLGWRYVDYFISVSQSILSWYEKSFGKKPMTLILNAPMLGSGDESSPERTYTSGDYFRRIYSIPDSKLIFVYVGVLGQGRGIETLMAAFSSGRVQSHIVFVGYGDLYNKIAEVSKKAATVHLHESVPHESVVSLVRNADVGLCIIENVSLSDYFCLPNKLFEYAFAGLPVLASRFPDIEVMVNKYGLGKCTDVDAQSVESAIIAIETNSLPPSATDLTDLSWEEQAKKLVNTYHILGQRRRI